MKLTAVFREASRDVSTGTSRTLFSWVVYVALVGLLVLHELFTVTGIIDRAEAYQAAGANTHIVISDGRIDGAACEALSRDHDVQSGAMRKVPEKLRVAAMSSVPLDQWVATTGMTGILDATGPDGEAISRAGVLVSEQVTDELGPGFLPLATDAGDLTFAGVFPYPDDGRMAGLGFSAIAPEIVQSKPYDQCWVKSWPEHPDTLSLLNSVVFPADSADAEPQVLTQWNTTLGASFDGATQFEQRISRFDSYLAILLGAVLGFFTVRLRRLELASARHAGALTAAQLMTQLLQQGVWIVLGSVLLTSVTWLLALGYPDATAALLGLALRSVALGAVGAFSGVTIAVCTIRERSLFAYFQNRS